MDSLSTEIENYINEIGNFFNTTGLSLSEGRIIGYLIICNPPYQNITTIANILNISKSTASTAISKLSSLGLVERRPVPDARGDFYAISELLWTQTLEGKSETSKIFVSIANKGLDLLSEKPTEQKQRLLEIRLLFAFMEEEMPRVMEKYRKFRQERLKNGILLEENILEE